MNEVSINVKAGTGDVYRIVLVPAPMGGLSEKVRDLLSAQGIEVSEIILGRIQGESSTAQKTLHQISGWIADRFAENPNLMLFYTCDDMNPIPSRNKKSINGSISVQEYRSRLFSRLFSTYTSSHHIIDVFNYPLRIDGEGYSYIIHLIARKEHSKIVECMAKDIMEGFGK